MFAISLIKSVDPAAGIDHLLLAREKGMAFIADFDLDRIAFFGAAGRKGFPARAGDADVMIIGMDIVFHFFLSVSHYFIIFYPLCQIKKAPPFINYNFK